MTFAAGRYRFTIYTDDGSRLYIDGQLTINAWWDQNGSVPHEAEVDLAGAHTLRYEFYEHTGPARAYLSWQAQVGLTAPVAVHLRVASGQYVVAEGGGGGAVNADRWVTGSWETFTLEDLNGGVLQDGDPVAFRTSAGYYLQAVSGGGGAMLAPAQSVGAWETFTILNLAQVGASIENGAAIGLLSSGSYYACAENGGGSVVNVNRSVVGSWETFVLEVASSPAVAAVPDESPSHPVAGPWAEEGGGPTSGATAFTAVPRSPDAPTSSPNPANEIVEYYHVDALGSVRVVTDGAGQVLRHHDFLPFGEEWQPPQSSPDQRLFTGKERDVETGLDYFGARYYRADLGRFTTVDPARLLLAAGQPQRWSRYAYALNNPLSFVDPNGKWPTRVHNRILQTAFPLLNRPELQLLRGGSAHADAGLLSSPIANYGPAHGMLAFDGQSLASAGYDMREFVDMWELAAAEYKSLWHMGVALHPIMDQFSPSHHGFAFQWTSVAWHWFAERTPTQEEFDAAVQACRWEYAERFGMGAYFAATGEVVVSRATGKFKGTIQAGQTVVMP